MNNGETELFAIDGTITLPNALTFTDTVRFRTMRGTTVVDDWQVDNSLSGQTISFTGSLLSSSPLEQAWPSCAQPIPPLGIPGYKSKSPSPPPKQQLVPEASQFKPKPSLNYRVQVTAMALATPSQTMTAIRLAVVVRQPNISVTNTIENVTAGESAANPASAANSDELVFHIAVTNSGAATAHHVVLNHQLPVGSTNTFPNAATQTITGPMELAPIDRLYNSDLVSNHISGGFIPLADLGSDTTHTYEISPGVVNGCEDASDASLISWGCDNDHTDTDLQTNASADLVMQPAVPTDAAAVQSIVYTAGGRGDGNDHVNQQWWRDVRSSRHLQFTEQW